MKGTDDPESGAPNDRKRTGEGREEPETAEVLVVGSGIAGCAAALGAARAGARVLVLTKATGPGDTTTNWARGGITVTRGDGASLKRDVLEASDGTADPDAVDVLVRHADDDVRDVFIETLAVPFDETCDGFHYAREAVHSESRILHVDASTGKHLLGPFLSHLDERADVTIRTDTAALELLTRDGAVAGVVTDESPTGHPIYAGATILATGGIGRLYTRSTNPSGATGDGIAMAALAGASVTDLEYVQFHPTGFAGDDDANGAAADDTPDGRTFLLSESLRGAGAVLRNGNGERFMDRYHDAADLAPRDVVARAVSTEREETGSVVLDVSEIPFEAEFPDLATACRARGVDGDEIPVAPVQHFLCGGITVDDHGRTSLDSLYAVGECSRTGVHGANRLASTSLLEGLVWGLRAGRDAVRGDFAHSVPPSPDEGAPRVLRNSDPALPTRFADAKIRRLQRTMDACLGIERTPNDVERAVSILRRLKGEVEAYVRTRTARDLYELRNACVTGLLIARAAASNPTSTGCHHVVTEQDPRGEVVPSNGCDLE